MATSSSFMKGFSEAYLADIGRIVIGWAAVEAKFHTLYLSMVVMRGASTGKLNSERVRQLMSLSLERQLREFRARLDEMTCSKVTREKYEQAFNQLDTLRNERDQVAHGIWTPALKQAPDGTISFLPNEAHSLSKSWKNYKPYATKKVRRDRLIDIFERIEELFWRLFRLSIERDVDFPSPQPA